MFPALNFENIKILMLVASIADYGFQSTSTTDDDVGAVDQLSRKSRKEFPSLEYEVQYI